LRRFMSSNPSSSSTTPLWRSLNVPSEELRLDVCLTVSISLFP
jgi:hypothetical protein